MAAPEDGEAGDAGRKRRHIFESIEQHVDLIRGLLPGDDEHGDGERESRVNERFESRHLDPTQTEASEARQGIEILRNSRSDLALANGKRRRLVHEESRGKKL